MTAAQARTALFVPGDRPERFPNAAGSGAQLVVIDLEDAVAEASKHTARDNACAWLTSLTSQQTPGPGVAWAVRINAVGTPWHDDDVQALAACPQVAIMVPKAEDPKALSALAAGGRDIVALVETALGVARAVELALVPGVVRLALGHLDLAADLHAEPDVEAMAYSRGALVIASRAAGLVGPFDGVTTDLSDAEVLASDVAHARRLGFGGKLCIHPVQVAEAMRAFSPGDADLAWARSVLDASRVGDGVSSLNGMMIDAPVIARAQTIVDECAAAARQSDIERETK